MKSPVRQSASETRLTDPLSLKEAETIGKAIIGARKRAGMTQVEIARAMGVTQGTVATLESGRSLPRLSTLQRLARATSTQLNLSFDPVSNHDTRTASHTMTDTLSRPRFSTDRRHFLGGAMGLAGLLDRVHHVSAEEATAAVEGINDFVWTPPNWFPEPPLFEIFATNEETTIVNTINGHIEIPTNPQRVVCLGDEQNFLFSLGVVDEIAGIGIATPDGNFRPNGDMTEEMVAAYSAAPTFPSGWEPDLEAIINLNPDLILGSTVQQEAFNMIGSSFPFIVVDPPAYYVPRQGLRDYASLFGRTQVADKLIAEFDALVSRAKEEIYPFTFGKKAAYGMFANELLYFFSTYLKATETDMKVNNPQPVWGSNLVNPIYKEFGMTPSSAIERLAEKSDHTSLTFDMSIEHLNEIDIDILFFYGDQDETEEFLTHPVVASSDLAATGKVIPFRAEIDFGYGIHANTAEISYLVEAITGEPFE